MHHAANLVAVDMAFIPKAADSNPIKMLVDLTFLGSLSITSGIVGRQELPWTRLHPHACQA